MNRTTRFFRYAKEIQRTSRMRQKVGAVVTRGSRAIKSACNAPGKPRIIGAWSRHAEVRATLNINAEGTTVYVYRQHALNYTPLLAKPCSKCVDWLSYVGVKEVVYSTSEYPFYEVMLLDKE